MSEVIPGDNYRNYTEIPDPPPPPFLTRVGKFILDHIVAFRLLAIALVCIGGITWAVMADLKTEEQNKAIAVQYLVKHDYKNVVPAYIWAPQGGFSTGSGCLGRKFEVNFSAESPDGKYIEGAVCCSNTEDCRFNKYFVK